MQYKDAFLKEHPTYKWYNPTKQTQPVTKSTAAVPTSAVHRNSAAATSASSVEQISAGKLAGNVHVDQ